MEEEGVQKLELKSVANQIPFKNLSAGTEKFLNLAALFLTNFYLNLSWNLYKSLSTTSLLQFHLFDPGPNLN